MSTDLGALFANLALGTLMSALMVMIHFWGLLGLTSLLRMGHRHLSPHKDRVHQARTIMAVVLGIFVLHMLEMWAYAAAYMGLDEFDSFEEALYFSISAYTTVGFGDLVMSTKWRVLSAIESANGWILFAWSTAFMLTVTTRLKLLEHEWLGSDEHH